ncbi:MAG: hypothetical protein M0T79_02165 [Actinomycetota bacterium]|nr:hypothetical protein [Actinomycetota bacterium]
MPRAKRKTLTDYERRYQELLEALAGIGFVRPGSVAPRYNYCGKTNCRCHGDPPQPHGPYFQWTAKVDGKTVNRRLSPREAELYREWIANDRRLRAMVDELRAVAAEATDLIIEEARRTGAEV